MKVTKTGRGFDLIEFEDWNEVKCTLQKSSWTNEQAIWFGTVEGTRMHLTRNQVQELLPYLINFIITGELNCPEM